MTRKRFLAIALLLALLFVAGIYGIGLLQHHNDTVATVTVNGEVIERINLDAVTDTRTLTIGEKGAQNVIEVTPAGIAVIKADCPDKTCVKQGCRKHGPTPIVCLPHHLSITFSEGNEAALDATTGH